MPGPIDELTQLVLDLGYEGALRVLAERLADARFENKTFEERRLLDAISKIKVAKEAKRAVEVEALMNQPEPPSWTGVEFLARPMPEKLWAVEGLVRLNANVTLTAPRKTGKSTMLLDYLRCRLDGERFLGEFTSSPLQGSLALWDYEMPDDQIQEWLARNPPQNAGHLTVLPLRGVSRPLTVPHFEDWAVDWHRQNGTEEWIIDPFARAFSGCGDENDNAEVGAFLDALDRIKHRAGIKQLVMAVHTGKDLSSGRSRGAMRLEDWPDALIQYHLDDPDNGQSGMRVLSAFGRDVDIPERVVVFHPEQGRLTLGGAPSVERDETNADRLFAAIEEAGNLGLTTRELRAIYKGLGVGQKAGDEIRDDLLYRRRIGSKQEGSRVIYFARHAGDADFQPPL